MQIAIYKKEKVMTVAEVAKATVMDRVTVEPSSTVKNSVTKLDYGD